MHAAASAQSDPQFAYLWEYVEHWAKTTPRHVALRCEGETITYQELAEQSRCLARFWLAHGVGKGDRVMTVLPSIPSYVVSLLAAGQIGAILVPMDVRYQASEIRRFLAQVEPAALVTVDRVGDTDVAAVMRQLRSELTGLSTITVGDAGEGISWSDALAAFGDKEHDDEAGGASGGRGDDREGSRGDNREGSRGDDREVGRGDNREGGRGDSRRGTPGAQRADNHAEVDGAAGAGGGTAVGPGAGRPTLAAARAALEPDDGALIIFTGGTTGVPKAALLSHRNVTTMCHLEVQYFRRWLADENDAAEDPVSAPPVQQRSLAALPPSHVGGTVELIGTALVAGWDLLMMASWSPYPVLEATAENRIPLMGAVPTMYSILLSLPDLDRFDLSSLRVAVLSGERVSLELLEGIRDRICPRVVVGYGSTEAGAEVTFTEPGDDLRRLADGYVGKPLPGVEIVIADDDGNPLPPGQVGEVLVRGPLTIRGYFRMPAEDEAGFINGYCRTGDLGYLTEDGGLYIQGRRKQIIRVGSYTVLPTEVEEVAARHPGVALAAAVGMPDPIYGEVVYLVVAPEAGRIIDEGALLDRCRRELADYKVPRRIVVRNDVPVTRIGKADRLALQAELLADNAAGN